MFDLERTRLPKAVAERVGEGLNERARESDNVRDKLFLKGKLAVVGERGATVAPGDTLRVGVTSESSEKGEVGNTFVRRSLQSSGSCAPNLIKLFSYR